MSAVSSLLHTTIPSRRLPRWLRALASAVAILFAVSLITFGLMQATPGDAAVAILGDAATPQALAALRTQLGLDLPLPQRYLHWLGDVLRGDLGMMFRSGEPVRDALLARLPVTLELVIGAQLVALLLAVPAAIYGAYRERGVFDRLAQTATIGFVSTPAFLIGLVLTYVFALKLGWLPATGYTPLTQSVSGNLRTMLLPALALGLAEFPAYLRLLRSEMIQTLQQNFILTARAMGLPPWRVLLQHALQPSSLSLVTAIGVNVGRLLGGAVIIEVLFGLPGIGSLLAESIYQREYLAVQGVVLCIAVAFVLINLTVDFIYGLLDPRVRVHE
jgi:peptide/nickel transport system permease protein